MISRPSESPQVGKPGQEGRRECRGWNSKAGMDREQGTFETSRQIFKPKELGRNDDVRI